MFYDTVSDTWLYSKILKHLKRLMTSNVKKSFNKFNNQWSIIMMIMIDIGIGRHRDDDDYYYYGKTKQQQKHSLF